MSLVEFFVPGKPAPQGSKRHVGRGILVESSRAVGPWRERIALAAAAALGGQPMFARGDALCVSITFVMPRPSGTPKRKTPPAIKRPDLDKLARACLDAVTNVLIHDDSAVVELQAVKRLAEVDESPGAHISIQTAVPAMPSPETGTTGTSGPLLREAR
jgi:crossover junction endodeoxyribonuclease RusA